MKDRTERSHLLKAPERLRKLWRRGETRRRRQGKEGKIKKGWKESRKDQIGFKILHYIILKLG